MAHGNRTVGATFLLGLQLTTLFTLLAADIGLSLWLSLQLVEDEAGVESQLEGSS